MDENDIPPALQGTFQQVKQDFTLNLESDAHDLAVERGKIREVVGELPLADPGAKKEIMKELLADPSYLQRALESLQKACQARGINPDDCRVFLDVILAQAGEGKIQIPL